MKDHRNPVACQLDIQLNAEAGINCFPEGRHGIFRRVRSVFVKPPVSVKLRMHGSRIRLSRDPGHNGQEIESCQRRGDRQYFAGWSIHLLSSVLWYFIYHSVSLFYKKLHVNCLFLCAFSKKERRVSKFQKYTACLYGTPPLLCKKADFDLRFSYGIKEAT